MKTLGRVFKIIFTKHGFMFGLAIFCILFAAVGGAGALLSKAIVASETIAYDDLGTEAIRKLTVKDFPVIVVIDSEGSNLYESAISAFRKEV